MTEKKELLPQIDEKGNMRIKSKRFGVGAVIGVAGSFVDEKTKEVKNYDEFIKILSGDFSLKLSPLACVWLIDALTCPTISTEIKKRADKERAELLKDIQGLLG